jgi:Tol biopolymer transport system component
MRVTPVLVNRVVFLVTGEYSQGMNNRTLLMLLLALPLANGQSSSAQAPANPVVKKIAFEVRHERDLTPQVEIFILDFPAAKPTRLVEGLTPKWSPTGQKLAFCTRTGGGFGQVEIINVDGSGRMPLTQLRGGACPTDWSADGETILATAYGTGTSNIFTMSQKGQNITQLAHGYGAHWSPDGRQIVFCRAAETHGSHGSIWVADSDGKNAKQVIEDDSPVLEVSWFPDGKSVAFASSRNPNRDAAIFRVNSDGSSLQQIASDKHLPIFFPVVSPDGSQLVVDGINSSDKRVLLLDLRTNRISTLAYGLHPSVIWEQH